MVLAWSGVETDQDKVASQIYTPGKQGTLTTDVLGGARRHGRLAVKVDRLDDVLREIAAGHPVIVFQNLGLEWAEQWHFAVAIGYDLEAGTIILHSGLDDRRVTPLTTFEQTWRRGDYWALVVLPPNDLPATAGEAETVEAALGIERTGHVDQAAIAYATIIERWPNSSGAWLGVGNIAYGRGDIDTAARAFRACHGGRSQSLARPGTIWPWSWPSKAIARPPFNRPKPPLPPATAISTSSA